MAAGWYDAHPAYQNNVNTRKHKRISRASGLPNYAGTLPYNRGVTHAQPTESNGTKHSKRRQRNAAHPVDQSRILGIFGEKARHASISQSDAYSDTRHEDICISNLPTNENAQCITGGRGTCLEPAKATNTSFQEIPSDFHPNAPNTNRLPDRCEGYEKSKCLTKSNS